MTKGPRGAPLRGEPRRQAYGGELALDELTAWCGRLVHLETDVLCLEEVHGQVGKLEKTLAMMGYY